jgi:hypothetical protein
MLIPYEYRHSTHTIEIDGNGLSSRELVNGGLAGNQITSVCRFRDRVYVTTLSGVFHKPYRDFLTFKPGA